MELIRGISLAERQKEGSLELEEVLSISMQLCDVLDAVHGSGIVHRDLKPDNIMLTERGESDHYVKLLDFGIAKFFDPTTGMGSGNTSTGMSLGTPGYMSPEQLLGDVCDHRTDIYALGVLMYEMVTGQKPFVADTIPKLMLAQTTEPPQRPSKITQARLPMALEALILACLERDPENRPQTIAVVWEQLKAIARGESPKRLRSPAAARRQRRRIAVMAAVAVVLAVFTWTISSHFEWVFGAPEAEREAALAKAAAMRAAEANKVHHGTTNVVADVNAADSPSAKTNNAASVENTDAKTKRPAAGPGAKKVKKPKKRAGPPRQGGDDALGNFFEQFE
jgi:hypothetical protein